MTQKEFDAQMMEINEQQRKEQSPVREEISSINSRQLELRLAIGELKMEIDKLNIKKHALDVRLKEINAKFHERKHLLVQEAPAKQKCPLM